MVKSRKKADPVEVKPKYDVFGRQVKIGDFVAASTMSYKSAGLRIGIVIGIKQMISIKPVTRRDNELHFDSQKTSFWPSGFVILDRCTIDNLENWTISNEQDNRGINEN